MELNVLTVRHFPALLRIALRKLGRMASGTAKQSAGRTAPDQPLIDVQALIREHSIEELNAAAEEYFRSLSSWDFHLTKPFGNLADAPGLLINFAIVLQGLQLRPGDRILDFGAGSGWTAHYLTQLGCEVVLLDVSDTALNIARERFRRHPIVGAHTPPQYLAFDGRTIDLPTASVDRILCFDAFHHAPNPDRIIEEFARILRPGGIAAFAEPGPQHSRSPQSQDEMRKYGVVENDIRLESIWATAERAGFGKIEVAALNIPPFRVSLDGYSDLLRGGETFLRWAEGTRAFLGDVRNFFLRRAGEEPLDSRTAGDGLRAGILIHQSEYLPAPRALRVVATVRNTGTAVWLPSHRVPGGVSLGCHLEHAGGELIAFDHLWQPLADSEVQPGEERQLEFTVPLENPGDSVLEFDCVANGICWFAQVGSQPTKLRPNIPPITAGSE